MGWISMGVPIKSNNAIQTDWIVHYNWILVKVLILETV